METGLPLASDENGPLRSDLQKIAAALWSKGVENVIITLGSSGSAVVREDGIRYIPCVHMDHVADPTAAGDSFTAALALGYVQTHDIFAAVRRANAAGALAATRMGAQPSLPKKEEIDAFLAVQKD